MELLVMLLVLVAVFGLAVVAFCLWVIGYVVGLLRHAFARAFAPQRRPLWSDEQACANPNCRCENPHYARFCRRCGQSLPSLLRAVASRAAVL